MFYAFILGQRPRSVTGLASWRIITGEWSLEHDENPLIIKDGKGETVSYK